MFLIDGDVQASKRREMLGRDVPMPVQSNSYFSSKMLAEHPERRARLPETESYRERFLAENCLDRALYAYAQRRVRREKSCVGCSEPVCSLPCLRGVETDRPTLWAKVKWFC